MVSERLWASFSDKQVEQLRAAELLERQSQRYVVSAFSDHSHLWHAWGPGLWRCWACPAVSSADPFAY